MGWTKLYKNNAVLTEPQSWSRTPLENMIGTELIHNDKKLAIYGNGTYWQSDTFETDVVQYGASPQRLVARRIEKYIDQFSFASIKQDPIGLTFDFRNPNIGFQSEPLLFADIWAPVDVKSKQLLQLPIWLILEIDSKHNTILFYTSKEKI